MQAESIKPLPKEISRWQSKWTQLLRRKDLVLYKQESKEGALHYNVMWVRRRKEKVWPNGKVTPAREALPTESEWGLYGWTYTELETAVKVFDKKKNEEPPKGCQ